MRIDELNRAFYEVTTASGTEPLVHDGYSSFRFSLETLRILEDMVSEARAAAMPLTRTEFFALRTGEMVYDEKRGLMLTVTRGGSVAAEVEPMLAYIENSDLKKIILPYQLDRFYRQKILVV